MGKVEDAVRDLIQYHSKRMATEVLGDVPAQLREARREVRTLQKDLGQLAGDVRELLEARRREMAVPPAPEEAVADVRFSKRTLTSLRRRFDLTQQELAELLEVSPVTVTAWETGKSRPRPGNLAQIVTLRGMAQSEVDEALGREPAPPAPTPAQLKRLRKKNGLTQAELAELVGVSTASVTSWEAGKTAPGRDNRRRLGELRQMSGRQMDQELGRHPEAVGAAAGATGGRLEPDQIRAIRKEAGLSQKEMAERIGVSVNSISNWETGRSYPRRGSVEKLLGMRPD
jgi:DNA-binding transcriptional regulator YiaG